MMDQFPLIGPWDPSDAKAAGVILCDAQNRILLQLRDINDRTVGPGHWSFFGGHVEGNESLMDAAIREFEEETSIRLAPNDLRPVARAQSYNGVQLYGFSAQKNISPDSIALAEGAGFAFLTPDQIRELPLLPAAGAILHHFIDNMAHFT